METHAFPLVRREFSLTHIPSGDPHPRFEVMGTHGFLIYYHLDAKFEAVKEPPDFTVDLTSLYSTASKDDI